LILDREQGRQVSVGSERLFSVILINPHYEKEKELMKRGGRVLNRGSKLAAKGKKGLPSPEDLPRSKGAHTD